MRCFGDKTRTHHCKVVLLDEQELIQEVQDATCGQDLLDVVLQHLNLLETAYFGLRFLDLDNQTHWLDPAKRLVKQLKGTSPFTLYFSVKFYAADPTKLVEEITRYQFFLQVKQDILQGRLPVSLELAAELGSYAVQSELGDYDPRRHSPGYVSEFRFLAGQTVALETKIAELHKKLVGQVPAKAELNYLEKIKWLDMYGVDLHPVLGEDNIEYFLGLTPSGAIVLRNKTKVGNYFWPRITKVYFRGRFFMLRVRDKNNSENTYGFETPSRAACKHLWQCCVEHHAFFRLTQSAGTSPQAVFSLGSKFRYSGRTEKEVQQEARQASRQQPEVTRTPSRRYQRRVVEGAVDTPRVEDADPKAEPRLPLSLSAVTSLTNSNVYRSTSMTLNGRGPSSPRSIRSAPHQASSSSSSVPPIGRLRPGEDAPLKPGQRTESRSESRGAASRSAESPRSVRSAAPTVTVEPRVSRRTSSVDSQSSIDSRGHRRHRRRSRCRSSDGESETSSKCSSKGHRKHHHRHRHHHRHHSDDSSEHQHKHKHRRHRHKSSDSQKQLVESESQWVRVQAGECKAKGHTATVRDLSSKTGHGPSVDAENDSQHHSSGKRRHRKHRSPSRSPNEAKNSRYPAELRCHIDYGLQDTNGLTEAELRDIPYKRVETATTAKTKYATTGKKHKSPRRSKSNSSDRKLTPPDGESPPPAYQDSTFKKSHSSSSRRKSKGSSSEERRVEGESRVDAEDVRTAPLVGVPYIRAAPSGESSTPPPPPSSVPPITHFETSQVPPPQQYGVCSPLSFPGYLPNGHQDGSRRVEMHSNHNSYGHRAPMNNGPSIKSIVTGVGGVTPSYRGLDTSSSNSISSDNNSSPSPHGHPEDRQFNGHITADDRQYNGHITADDRQYNGQDGYLSSPHPFIGSPAPYLKPSSLERGTRGSSITKPQPSPQSSVTSGISVGGSSVSTSSAESTLTAASPPKPPLIRTSDLSTSPSSSSPPPNDRDSDHVFYNPCNSVRAHSFFSSHSAELFNNSSSAVSVDDTTLDDSHDTNPHEPYYTNCQTDDKQQNLTNKSNRTYSDVQKNSCPAMEPYTQHSTNILIRYHDSDRSASTPDSCSTPTPLPRSSIISSVLSTDSSTHIVQSYGPAYANTFFSNKNLYNNNNKNNDGSNLNSASPLPRPSSNSAGIPTYDHHLARRGNFTNAGSHSASGSPLASPLPPAPILPPRPVSKLQQQQFETNHQLSSRTGLPHQATSNYRPTATSSPSHYSGSYSNPNAAPYSRTSFTPPILAHPTSPRLPSEGSQGGDGRSDLSDNAGPLSEYSSEAARSARAWTNSLSRAAPGRPSYARQRSDGPPSLGSGPHGPQSSAGSLELILGPLIQSALHTQGVFCPLEHERTSTTIMEEEEPPPTVPPKSSLLNVGAHQQPSSQRTHPDLNPHSDDCLPNGYAIGLGKDHSVIYNGNVPNIDHSYVATFTNGNRYNAALSTTSNGYYNTISNGNTYDKMNSVHNYPPSTIGGYTTLPSNGYNMAENSKRSLHTAHNNRIGSNDSTIANKGGQDGADPKLILPGGKPSLPPRPHSIHTDAPVQGFPNGSIITQIRDQDGYRATRVPIAEEGHNSPRFSISQEAPKTNNLNDSQYGSLRSQDSTGSLRNARVSNHQNEVVTAEQYRHSNAKAQFVGESPNQNCRNENTFLSCISQNNDLNSNIQRNEKSVGRNSSARYSYPNAVANDEGIHINNLLNNKTDPSSGGATVSDIVAKLNGALVTTPNGNRQCEASFAGQEGPTQSCRNRAASSAKGGEEISTEL